MAALLQVPEVIFNGGVTWIRLLGEVRVEATPLLQTKLGSTVLSASHLTKGSVVLARRDPRTEKNWPGAEPQYRPVSNTVLNRGSKV